MAGARDPRAGDRRGQHDPAVGLGAHRRDAGLDREKAAAEVDAQHRSPTPRPRCRAASCRDRCRRSGPGCRPGRSASSAARDQRIDRALVADVGADEQRLAIDARAGARSPAPRPPSVSPITTLAPSSTRRSAIAAPMPRAAPITTAILPSTRPVIDAALRRESPRTRSAISAGSPCFRLIGPNRILPSGRRDRIGVDRGRAGLQAAQHVERAQARGRRRDRARPAAPRGRPAAGPRRRRGRRALRPAPASAPASARGAAPASSATNSCSAVRRPTISSLPTLHGRPMPCCGRPRSRALSMKCAGGVQCS